MENSSANYRKEELCQAVRSVIREELAEFMQGMGEGAFYQNLALEMESGIGEMYQAITEFKQALNAMQQTADTSQQLITDASGQLEAIVTTTEMATNQIMDATESCQKSAAVMRALLDDQRVDPEQLKHLLESMEKNYMDIVTSCSFQDLTGQRVRRVVALIRSIEKQVIKLLVRSGVKMREKQAGKDNVTIEGSTRKALEKLSRPDAEGGIDQAGVDELLASLMS